RLDATLEHGEERAVLAHVHRVLAGHEADVRGQAGEQLPLARIQPREQADAAYLLGRYHARLPNGRVHRLPDAPDPAASGCRAANAIRFSRLRGSEPTRAPSRRLRI